MQELATQIESRLKSAGERRMHYFDMIRERTGSSMFRASPEDAALGDADLPPDDAGPPSPSNRSNVPVPMPWSHLVLSQRAQHAPASSLPKAKTHSNLMKNLRRRAAKLRKRLVGAEATFTEPPWLRDSLEQPEIAGCLRSCYELREVCFPSHVFPTECRA